MGLDDPKEADDEREREVEADREEPGGSFAGHVPTPFRHATLVLTVAGGEGSDKKTRAALASRPRVLHPRT